MCDRVSLAKDVIEQRCAELVALDDRKMPGPGCFGRRAGAFFIAEYKRLAVRPERAPARESITLDHPEMPLKRLGRAENGQHATITTDGGTTSIL